MKGRQRDTRWRRGRDARWRNFKTERSLIQKTEEKESTVAASRHRIASGEAGYKEQSIEDLDLFFYGNKGWDNRGRINNRSAEAGNLPAD